MIFVDNKLSAICIRGYSAAERLIKGILMWVCCTVCIFDNVDTCRKPLLKRTLLVENRYCRYLKRAETKTEKPCPTFPKSYMVY